MKRNEDSNHGGSPRPVSVDRWLQAQKWELAFWNRQNVPPPWWKRMLRPLAVFLGIRPKLQKPVFDDRNYWWKEKFNNYESLPLFFENACELGCGPYTNIRLIQENRTINYIHCSDPLAKHYIKYKHAWLAKAYSLGLISIDFHSAEECPYKTGYFDLTVLINVLDHVKDPMKCLNEAIRITKSGGYFVFGQDLTDDDDKKPANPGHPFTFRHETLESLLDQTLTRIHYQLVPQKEVLNPEMHYGALVYIGLKNEF